MTKTILMGGAVGIAVLAVIFFFVQRSPREQPEEETMSPSLEAPASQKEEEMKEEKREMTDNTMREHVVIYSGNSYSPREITIQRGDTVTFRNESTRETWPASAFHPSHRVYPGSGIEKCDTEERDIIFDACRGLKQGEQWSFRFQETGEWFFHDHLMPEVNGKIIVEE